MHQLQYLHFTTGHKTARRGQALACSLGSMQWPSAEPCWRFLTLRPFFQPLDLLVTIKWDLANATSWETQAFWKERKRNPGVKRYPAPSGTCKFRLFSWPVFYITVSKHQGWHFQKHLHLHFPKSWLPMKQRPVYEGCKSWDVNLVSNVAAWCLTFPCTWLFNTSAPLVAEEE